MIYARFGDEITLLREASLLDVLKDWGHAKWSKSKKYAEDEKIAAERVGYGMMWWAKFQNGEERIAELAYCRADDGWKEIDDTRRKIMGEARYAEACGKPV